MIRYPACKLSDLYPPLIHIPPEERLAYVEQAERGEPLRSEQLKALGFWSGFTGFILLPTDAAATTPAQLAQMFPNQHVMGEIVRLSNRKGTA